MAQHEPVWITTGQRSRFGDDDPDRRYAALEQFARERSAGEQFAGERSQLGCIVRWTPAQTTWHCPCHGPRFAMNGSVSEGPAVDDVERQDIRSEQQR